MIETRCGVREARVLDLYAGTGALGLEALSRGATQATFVERRRDALVALRENVAALGVGAQSRILGRTVEALGVAAGSELGGPFELVFADPPYADVQSGAAPRALERVRVQDLLASEEALLVLEHSSKTPAPSLPKLVCLETRVYGDTQISFYGLRPRPEPSGSKLE